MKVRFQRAKRKGQRVKGKGQGLRIKGKDRRQTSEVGDQKTESRN